MCSNKAGKIGKPKEDLCCKYLNSYLNFNCSAFEFEMPVSKTNVEGYMFTVKYTKECVSLGEPTKAQVVEDYSEPVMEQPQAALPPAAVAGANEAPA